MVLTILAVVLCSAFFLGYMIYAILDGIRYHEDMAKQNNKEDK